MFVVGFSYHKGNVLSWAIKKLTKSPVSHAYLRFNILDAPVVVQSSHRGVTLDYYPCFQSSAEVVNEFSLDITKQEQDQMLSFAIKRVDLPYDYKAMAGFFWVILNSFVGRKIKNPFRNKNAYFCSELALMALKEINFSGTANLDRELISPDALMDFLASHPKAKKL